MNGKMSQTYVEESSDEGNRNSPYYDAQTKLIQDNISEISVLRILQKWLPERRNTLTKLRLLLKEVQDEALKFNETQTAFKEQSFNSGTFKRKVKNAIKVFSSLGALIGDLAGGKTSVAETCNVDSYQTRLQGIIDHDTTISKELYNARSQCMTKYLSIEKLIRNPDTEKPTTIDKESFIFGKHCTAIQKAKNDERFLNAVSDFLGAACLSEALCVAASSVLQYIQDNPAAFEAQFSGIGSLSEALGAAASSVTQYLDDNPAVFEACKSILKATCEARSIVKAKSTSENGIVKREENSADENKEMDRPNRVIKKDGNQNKLESKIRYVIYNMEKGLKEMNEVYLQLKY